jgi:hypothetical protein
MATTTSPACIGEPISWLRLEQFAVSRRDVAVSDHVAACPACRACLDEIERDVVALPPLAIPETKPRRRWWTFALPAGVALAAAAILLLVLRPHDESSVVPRRFDRTAIKGVGMLEVGVVRNRGGITRDDVRTYVDGDRWKVIVTCSSDRSASVWVDVFVHEAQGSASADFPFAPQEIACGNAVPLAGAFELTGHEANLVCVRVSTEGMPPRLAGRSGEPGDSHVACVTLSPE